MHAEVAIIGGGPAGISSAIQLSRYGIKPMLFEQKRLGGLLWNANLVENYLGFPGGISGKKLVEHMSKQLETNEHTLVFDRVRNVFYEKGQYEIYCDDGEYTADILVISSGTRPNRLKDMELTAELKEKIFYNVADLNGIQNKEISIIGGGDAAFDYAMNLSNRKNKVNILNRSDETKCLPLLEDRVANCKDISYLNNISVQNLSISNDKLLLNCISCGQSVSKSCDLLGIAIGRSPERRFINKQLEDRIEALMVMKSLFFIGDVKNDIYRQVSISVGDGVRAAMEIYRELRL